MPLRIWITNCLPMAPGLVTRIVSFVPGRSFFLTKRVSLTLPLRLLEKRLAGHRLPLQVTLTRAPFGTRFSVSRVYRV